LVSHLAKIFGSGRSAITVKFSHYPWFHFRCGNSLNATACGLAKRRFTEGEPESSGASLSIENLHRKPAIVGAYFASDSED
jgi:hypothetical protein